ncbi:hypothetical protein EV198_0128 [Roseivirga ehrenbergii]|uniref:Uncharacterized protein n=1 Tax=Roseivirga ehrenbergii (strain DSM 102268 / JCM 13514 / KCTC 12282 / NCIMB 14502 / KMM 6017) TaxID=279360 RepID=A0A150X022_ROSEK|nr:hypothetical protein [Roseivirga ehrenbergii]KYG72079.1 hypothetical protein MB14_08480 [Roseivirga ehrenbergii]TCL13306.1 hypothetical protein EV198_0128 [Roseivirga ehrenbergii]
MTYKIISGFFVSVAIIAGLWVNRSKPQVVETQLPPAFEEFDKDNTTIYIDGENVVIESNGMPKRTRYLNKNLIIFQKTTSFRRQ